MKWHTLSAKQALSKLSVTEDYGLSSQQAECRLQSFGENKLATSKKKSIFSRFLAQLNDFMIIVLLLCAGVSLAVSFLSGEPDFTDPVVILLIVLINAGVGVVQESRAQNAIDKLRETSHMTVSVVREGKAVEISPELLVPGDIIKLKAGDIVPADARLISSVGLCAEEAALTGESEAVMKDADFLAGEKCDVCDRKNMVFSSSAVVAGSGVAVVCETGMKTQIGEVASLLLTQENDDTPLQKRLANMGKVLGIAALAICAVIFVLGVLRRVSVLDTFMLSVSLAVAAIPEGLPAIVTASLALGVRALARENAIIRRLPAVETLGSATVICSDKTGTLTQNKMTVEKIYGNQSEILTLGVLCSNAKAERENGVMTASGDPTEIAIVVKALEQGIIKPTLDREFVRVKELPFDSNRKLMTTVHKTDKGFRVITKGALDILAEKCEMSIERRREMMYECDKMAGDALRVLAVAYKDVRTIPPENSLECGLNLVGLIGIIDPARPEVLNAVKECQRAGVRAVMITGDAPRTACAIASKIGIASDRAITGIEIDEMTDRKLQKAVKTCSVFARVTPKHKVRIVRAFKSNGEVVAMTGDGINDAPALKSADIGCAMGKNGTDVAKSASDMILLDDNFATIVKAVRHGRAIYDNIKKSVRFLLSCNIGEILAVLLSSLLSLPSPLLAIQLLWVNLITDSLPAIALGFEPIDRDIMKRKPIKSKAGMFSRNDCADLFLEGCLIGALTLLSFIIGRSFFDITGEPLTARTMAFCVLSISQLIHAFNVRNEKSIFKIGVFSNRKMCLAFPICLCLQVATVVFPPLRTVFRTVPLGFLEWLIITALSLTPLVVCEILKRLSK